MTHVSALCMYEICVEISLKTLERTTETQTQTHTVEACFHIFVFLVLQRQAFTVNTELH